MTMFERLNVLCSRRFHLEQIVNDEWTPQTRAEIQQRLKDIEAELDRLSKNFLAPGIPA